MSRLIKAGTSAGSEIIRSLGSGVTDDDQVGDTVSEALLLDPELSALRQENAQLQETLNDLREVTGEALETALEEGRKQAIQAYQHDETMTLELLGSSLSEATDILQKRLASWDALALAVAQSSLEKILRGPDVYDDVLSRMIGHQIDSVRRDAVVSVSVSKIDFPDVEALEQLRLELGLDAVEVIVDDQLSGGSCELALRLGHVEVSLDQQWEDLRAVFDDIGAQREWV